MKTARHLLLVEDDPDMVEVITLHFAKVGFEVHCTDRLDIAMELLEKHPITAVVTDFHIQQGSGRRLLYAIRKTNDTLPVFLITGTPFVSKEDFAAFKFDGVFLKPFRGAELVEAVLKACDTTQSTG